MCHMYMRRNSCKLYNSKLLTHSSSSSCAVLGRSIVVYGSGSQSSQILGCANIEPSLVAEEKIEISFPRNGSNPEDFDKVLLHCMQK